jgi:hypothetical protein
MRGPAALIGRTASKPLLARHYLQIGDQMLTLGSGLKNSVMMKLNRPAHGTDQHWSRESHASFNREIRQNGWDESTGDRAHMVAERGGGRSDFRRKRSLV